MWSSPRSKNLRIKEDAKSPEIVTIIVDVENASGLAMDQSFVFFADVDEDIKELITKIRLRLEDKIRIGDSSERNIMSNSVIKICSSLYPSDNSIEISANYQGDVEEVSIKGVTAVSQLLGVLPPLYSVFITCKLDFCSSPDANSMTNPCTSTKTVQ